MRYLAGWVLLCVLLSSVARAADDPNLIVVTEDIHEGAIPRSSQVYKAVLMNLQEQMHTRGFDVFDESAFPVMKFVGRQSDAVLMGAAKSVMNPPLDVMLVFTLYARVDTRSAVHKVRAITTGRLLNVKTGQFLGAFETQSGETWTIAANCLSACQQDVLSKYGKILAQELGAVLAEKLDWLINGGESTTGSNGFVTGYSLIFNNLPSEAVNEITNALPALNGYAMHRPSIILDHQAEFWFESSANAADIKRQITQLVNDSVSGIEVNMAGNTLSFIKREKKPRPENFIKPVPDSL